MPRPGVAGDNALAGDYPAASSSLAVSRQLNPLLTSSTAYDLALGQVLLAAGSRDQPLALLAEAYALGAGGDPRAQVTELRQAWARDPANPVLLQQLDQASQVLGLNYQDPGSLQALSDPTVGDQYTEGRILYAQADYPAALACFRRVLTMTKDANVTSSSFTYIALSELKLGQADQARRDLLRAVGVDTAYNNTLARSLIAGLYVSTKSGDA
jgi:tetratricopeptide (TPR) repeat protein